MSRNTEAVFLDVGNTLRILVHDEAHQARARRRLAELAGTSEPPEAFCQMLDARYKAYRRWAFETMVEAPEVELWTRWMLPELPAGRIVPLAGELTYLYRQSMGRRVLQRDALAVVAELDARGYRLGVISNVITEHEIPEWLEAEGLAPYFKTVVLSSVLGRRKPDPAIFLEAAARAGVAPARSAYVGDNPSRDVVGARQAGFGMVVIMMEPAEPMREPPVLEHEPDLVIYEFGELLDVFPARL